MTWGVSVETAAANLSAAFGPCAHRNRADVTSAVTGALLAQLCVDCSRQLPADWA